MTGGNISERSTPIRTRHQRDKDPERPVREPQRGFKGRTFYIRELRAALGRIERAGSWGFDYLREQVQAEDEYMRQIDHNNVGDLKPEIADDILGRTDETGQS